MIPIKPVQVRDNLDEPEAIRNLKKKAIYKLLSEQWLLPEESSKGVHRRYLVGVYRGDYFRVNIMEYKRFEVELTPAQLKKTPFLSSGDVFVKISHLLTEIGIPPLGFEVGLFPEDTWLYKIVRFVDRSNATGVYLQIAPPRQPPLGAEPVSNQMIAAKRHAEAFPYCKLHELAYSLQCCQVSLGCPQERDLEEERDRADGERASSLEREVGHRTASCAVLLGKGFSGGLYCWYW